MIIKEKFDFIFAKDACKSCGGKCCIGASAYAWINDREIKDLAKYLEIPINKVYENYLIKVGRKYSLTELEIDDKVFACIFFDTEKKECSIYKVRPEQCRTFPFWDEYLFLKDETFYSCPGVRLV